MKLWKLEQENDAWCSCISLWEAFGLEQYPAPCVIAVAGSGGKTSLLGRLAKEGTERKKKVAVLTTTHIKKPPTTREVFSGVGSGEALVYGVETGEGKITFPGEECYRDILKGTDLVLVEADGSKGLPLKALANHEPVIPKEADLILTVGGLSGLGRPLRQVCHRWELAEELLDKGENHPNGMMDNFISEQGCPVPEKERPVLEQERPASEKERSVLEQKRPASEKDHPVSEHDIYLMLEYGYGLRLEQAFPRTRRIFCLNQADTEEKLGAAKRILSQIGREGIALSLLGDINPLYLSRKGISMIYLASGYGKRFGANKLLAQVAGKPLFMNGLDCLKEAAALLLEECGGEAEIIVVSQYEEINIAASSSGVRQIHNPYSSQGITASLKLGVRAAAAENDILFAVADQPWLSPRTVTDLIKKYQADTKSIACLSSQGERGNPVLFSARYRDELLELTGDRGGARILKKYPREVLYVEADPHELQDIDTPVDAGGCM